MAEIRVNATGALKLYDNDDSHFVGLQAGSVSSNVTFTLPTADGSNGQVLTTNGSGALSFATASSADPTSADGDSLGTASAEWSDLFLADGGTIQFGNDQDVTLTHVADTALLLNSAMQLQFRDSGLYIGSNADGDLDIVSDGTAVDSINLESAGGITLDAGSTTHGITYEDDGTAMLRITNSSSDVIIKPLVDAKDIIFQQYDGTEVARIEDNATFNVSSAGKFAYAGTAVTATAAEMNLLDGGTSVGSSITLADADGIIVNDGGTMKTIPASDISTYASGNLVQTGSLYSYNNNTSSVSINDCFETDYDMYLVMFNILPASNGVSFRVRLMDGGTNIEASKHHFVSKYYDADGNASDNRSETQGYFTLADSVSSREYDGGLVASLTCFLDRDQTSSCAFKYTGNLFFTQSNSSPRVHNTYVSGQLDDTETNENVTGIKLFFGSGNIANVNLQVYGLKGSAS